MCRNEIEPERSVNQEFNIPELEEMQEVIRNVRRDLEQVRLAIEQQNQRRRPRNEFDECNIQ